VWSIALAINPSTGEAQATDRVEHTTELGGSALGNISSFGVDADGELYVVGYSSGRIVKVLGRGQLTKALTVRAHAFSAAAIRAIEGAGGRTERLPLPFRRRPPAKGNALTNR